MQKTFNVLFLCTGNTGRSIMGEGLLNLLGQGRFKAYSAGSKPGAQPNPFALEQLQKAGCDTSAMYSKSWDVFEGPDAPVMDIVITVCDKAAKEPCPVWPGQPMTAHWGIEDPAAVDGPDIQKEAAFVAAFRYMKNRISTFTSLSAWCVCPSYVLETSWNLITVLPGVDDGASPGSPGRPSPTIGCA